MAGGDRISPQRDAAGQAPRGQHAQRRTEPNEAVGVGHSPPRRASVGKRACLAARHPAAVARPEFWRTWRARACDAHASIGGWPRARSEADRQSRRAYASRRRQARRDHTGDHAARAYSGRDRLSLSPARRSTNLPTHGASPAEPRKRRRRNETANFSDHDRDQLSGHANRRKRIRRNRHRSRSAPCPQSSGFRSPTRRCQTGDGDGGGRLYR